MWKGMVLGRREQQMAEDLTDALAASDDLHAVLKDAYPLLLPLVGADYGALAAPRSERTDEYEWIDQNLPPAFLGSYEEMAPHDFVQSSVLKRIHVVVPDSEMIDRRAYEGNMMYQRSRELGSPVEQVMAVMLHADGSFRSGLSVYRARRRPFSERHQRILQLLTPSIANAVRKCRSFAKEARWSTTLDVLLGSERRAVIVVRPPARELDRTALATALLDVWFEPVERGVGGLPRVLLDELAKARAVSKRGYVRSWRWKKQGDEADLEVEFLPLPERAGEASWALVLREVSCMPAAWATLLTKRERQILSRVVRGWGNPLIAQDLSIKLNTVKKHVQHILDELGMPDRKQLIAQAARDA